MVMPILTAPFCSGVSSWFIKGKVTKTELTQAAVMLSKLTIGVVANGSSGSSNVLYTREYEVVSFQKVRQKQPLAAVLNECPI